jgi:Pyruvate/2-oxoacid:ferredoxin oxidoreductase delta subunit
MVLRNVVKIIESKCNGCGECIPKCVEGALLIVDGKARLVKDDYCDGLGACLGHCPQDAIKIIKREAEPFDEEAVHAYLAHGNKKETITNKSSLEQVSHKSQLSHWPVKLYLVPLEAPFFDGKELLVMADCVPVAYPNLHNKLLIGRSVVLGCPKFDDVQHYVDKLTEIIQRKDIPISMCMVRVNGDIE